MCKREKTNPLATKSSKEEVAHIWENFTQKQGVKNDHPDNAMVRNAPSLRIKWSTLQSKRHLFPK